MSVSVAAQQEDGALTFEAKDARLGEGLFYHKNVASDLKEVQGEAKAIQSSDYCHCHFVLFYKMFRYT